MAHGHDTAFFGSGRHFQTIRQRAFHHHQGMVATANDRTHQPGEQAAAVVMNQRSSPVYRLGCQIDPDRTVRLGVVEADGVAPPDFYSTTNQETFVHHDGAWLRVDNLRMDGVIVVKGDRAAIRKFRNLRRGDRVALGLSGIRVKPEVAERDRVVAVAGPVVVHTGGAPELARLIRHGYVHALLAGNALAVHDVETALYGTSLGTDLSTGKPVEMGHRNHLRAINEVRRAGSLGTLVEEGKLGSGVMYEAIKAGIPFSLAGSLRDDGPLPETVTDMNRAQDDYARLLQDTDIVLMLASMLHSIAVGNMIPARVLTICVDINPAVVTKLKDRGSLQTIGVVTDVGLFLHLLADALVAEK